MIPPRGYLRRVIMTLAIVAVPLLFGLLFSYDIIKINWASGMEIQPSIGPQEGPRRWAPNDAVPFAGPSVPLDIQQAENPIPPDATSLQRGQLLYERHCAPCHGASGRGDGPITRFWQPEMRKPADLTEPRIKTASDGTIYLTIAKGYGTMPPLNENMNVRERWDTVNYVKALGQ